MTDSSTHARRHGFTLLELLVAIAIIALMIGLLLPAIQKIRTAAARMKLANQVRQFSMANANYASAHDGRFPAADGMGNPDNRAAFFALLPYVEQAAPNWQYEQNGPSILRNPYDPTWMGFAPNELIGNVSFSLNALLFQNGTTYHTIRDGTSTTIAITERYATCSTFRAEWQLTTFSCYRYENGRLILQPTCGSGPRRPTFADAYFNDVVPVHNQASNSSTPSIPDLTFQTRPLGITECDSRIPQATFEAGILTASADGSVRTITSMIAPSVYWSMVTPQGGERIDE